MPFSHTVLKKKLNKASHFTAITTNIRSINSQPVKVKVNVGIGEGWVRSYSDTDIDRCTSSSKHGKFYLVTFPAMVLR